MNEENLITIIANTLSKTCDVICETQGIQRAKVYELTQKFIEQNSEEWKNNTPAINYRNPYCRMAYIYMNVAVHSHLIKTSFIRNKATILESFETNKKYTISSFGGGPGSELIGVVSFLVENAQTILGTSLDFLLVDKVAEWDDSWHALKDGIDDYLESTWGKEWRRWPFIISRSFLPLDVTLVDDFVNFGTRFRNTNLFLFSYICSELKAKENEFRAVVEYLTRQARTGALFLFIDRNETQVRKLVERIIGSIPILETINSETFIGRIDYDLSKFGEWYINIESLPRRSWQTFTIIGRITR